MRDAVAAVEDFEGRKNIELARQRIEVSPTFGYDVRGGMNQPALQQREGSPLIGDASLRMGSKHARLDGLQILSLAREAARPRSMGPVEELIEKLASLVDQSVGRAEAPASAFERQSKNRHSSHERSV